MRLDEAISRVEALEAENDGLRDTLAALDAELASLLHRVEKMEALSRMPIAGHA